MASKDQLLAQVLSNLDDGSGLERPSAIETLMVVQLGSFRFSKPFEGPGLSSLAVLIPLEALREDGQLETIYTTTINHLCKNLGC